jgi:hypothetical protein
MTSASVPPAAPTGAMTGRAGGTIKLIIGLAALAEIIAVGVWFIPGQHVGDMDVYEKIAFSAASNSGTLESEYPPAVSAIFLILKILAPHADFTHVWVMFVICILALAYFYCMRRAPSTAYLLPLGALAAIQLLGIEVTLIRYDILVMIFLFLAWQMYAQGRSFAGAMCLAVAASLKIVPVVILPVMFVASSRIEWKKLAGGALAGFLLPVAAVFLLLGWHGAISNVTYMLGYHGARGIEVESFWSSIDLLWRNQAGQMALLGFHHHATHNEDFGRTFSWASGFAALIGIAIIYLHLWNRRSRPAKSNVEYWFLLLLWITSVAPVFSPQYLIWSVPLILMWVLDEMISGRGVKQLRSLSLIALVAVTIALLTQWIFPSHFFSLNKQSSSVVIGILVARNLAMFVLIWLLGHHIQIAPAMSLSAVGRNERADRDLPKEMSDSMTYSENDV